MNKKLFFFILVLVLIPTVAAQFSPGDIGEKVIGWLSGDLGAGSENFAAYARIAFSLIIGFIVYEVISRMGASEKLSVVIAGFFAIIGVLFAPKSLLVAASSTYNVLIWLVILGFPIFIVSFLIYHIPKEPRAWRLLKILLLGLILVLLALSLNGFFEAFGNLGSIKNNVNFLASWFYVIIVIAIIYQFVRLVSPAGLGQKIDDGIKSKLGLGPSTTPSAVGIPSGTATPSGKSGKNEERKKFKKQAKEFKKAIRKQNKKSNEQIKDLSKQIAMLQDMILDKKEEPQTPETQEEINNNMAALNRSRQILVKQLSDLSNHMTEEEQVLRNEIKLLKQEMAELVLKSQDQSLSYEGREIINHQYMINKDTVEKKGQQLNKIIRARVDAQRQSQEVEKGGIPNSQLLLSENVDILRDEAEIENLEREAEEFSEQMEKADEKLAQEFVEQGSLQGKPLGQPQSQPPQALQIESQMREIIQKSKNPNLSLVDKRILETDYQNLQRDLNRLRNLD